MVAGRPVIASVALDSDTAEMVRQAGCGLVVPPQDAGALAHAIRRAADDRDLTRRRGENARRCLLDRYSRKHCTGLYEAILAGQDSLVMDSPGRKGDGDGERRFRGSGFVHRPSKSAERVNRMESERSPNFGIDVPAPAARPYPVTASCAPAMFSSSKPGCCPRPLHA